MFTFWLVFHRPYIEGRSSTADTAPVMADITWVMAEPRPRGNPRLKRQVTQVTLPTDDFPNQHGCCLVLASSQYQQLKFSSQQNLIYIIYNMHIYIYYMHQLPITSGFIPARGAAVWHPCTQELLVLHLDRGTPDPLGCSEGEGWEQVHAIN